MSISCGLLAALEFENVGRPWLWFGLIGAAGAVLVATYRGIARRSERRLAWGLMALRGAGLAALVLALARPTWTRQADLVDPPRLAVVVDTSASMGLLDVEGSTRYARARAAVDRLAKALDRDRSAPAVAIDLFDVRGNPLPTGLPETPADGRTDLVRAVGDAAARLRSRPMAGVVLISDGMDTTGRSVFRELADVPVPVHTLGFRPPTAGADLDLAVRGVQAPERAMVHNAIKVEVRVAKAGGPATRAVVAVRRGAEAFATQSVALGAGAAEQVIPLTITPTQPGRFVFTASVASEAGERRLGNNAASFPLRVDADPIRVLYVEGFLRFEYKFLKARLEDDPDVSLVSVVRRANPERADDRAGADLLSPERLRGFDVVILGDMEGSYLGAAEYQAILKWLDGAGHALLVLGGSHSFGPDGFRKTPLADALPVRLPEGDEAPSEEPFVLQLTEAGRRHPIFELTGDRVRDAATWASAPPLSGSSPIRGAKPAAVVLAVNPNLVRDGQPAVVVAVHRFGGGHVMVLAADTTWRWTRLTRALGQDDTLFARFWSQALRWLSGRASDDARPVLAVSTDRPDYEVGKPATIRVVRQPRPGLDLTKSELAAEVVGPTGRRVAVPLRASSAEPDAFSGTFAPAEGGRFRVEVALNAGGKTLANQAAEFVATGADLERADGGTNPAALRAIAAATGGQALDVSEAEALAGQIERRERRITRSERTEFWNSPWLFGVFLGAVTGEWLLRRRNHLV